MITVTGIDDALAAISVMQSGLQSKVDEVCRRCAELGLTVSQAVFESANYDGINDVTVEIQETDDGFIVHAYGAATWFIEYGAGLIGYGHPEVGALGPGTYPGKGHWSDPKGWWLPSDVAAEIGKLKSHGNAAQMPMYNAKKTIESQLESIVREVFAK